MRVIVPTVPTLPEFTPDEALRWLLSPTPLGDRDLLTYKNQAFKALDTLAPAERVKALLELVAKGPEGAAERAAGTLIHEQLGDPTVVGNTIAAQVGQWSGEGPVKEMAYKVQLAPGLLVVARSVLQYALADGRPIALKPAQSTNPEVAAMVLAEHGTAADAEVVRQAVRRQPASRTLWYAVAASGGATGPDAKLAHDIRRNTSRPDDLRIAAATAVAPTDPDAAAFVVGGIEGVLARFGDKDEEAALAMAPSFGELRKLSEELRLQYSAPTQSRFYEVFLKVGGEIQHQLLPLAALRFLHVPAAEDLTKRLLQAVDPWCHDVAAVTAALRWPDLLLVRKPPHLAEKQYARVLATLVLRHPERQAEAEKAFGGPLPADAREEASTSWVAGASTGAELVTGW
jgi:hypothetical protein